MFKVKIILTVTILSVVLLSLRSCQKNDPVELPYMTNAEISNLGLLFKVQFPSSIQEVRAFIEHDNWLSLYSRIDFSKSDLRVFMSKDQWKSRDMFSNNVIEEMMVAPADVPWLCPIWQLKLEPLSWWNPQKERIKWISFSAEDPSSLETCIFIEECDNGRYRGFLKCSGALEEFPHEVIGPDGILDPYKEGWQKRTWEKGKVQ